MFINDFQLLPKFI